MDAVTEGVEDQHRFDVVVGTLFFGDLRNGNWQFKLLGLLLLQVLVVLVVKLLLKLDLKVSFLVVAAMGARVDVERELWQSMLFEPLTESDEEAELVSITLTLRTCIKDFPAIHCECLESEYRHLRRALAQTKRQVAFL